MTELVFDAVSVRCSTEDSVRERVAAVDRVVCWCPGGSALSLPVKETVTAGGAE